MMGLGLLLVILVVYMIYKNYNRPYNPNGFGSSQNTPYDEALDVLKMKFVNGEITEEEYLRKRHLLMK